MTMNSMIAFWDRLGISASLLCVIHCLLTPVLVLSAPIVGHALSELWFHLLILVVVYPVAMWALWRGYRLHRKKITLKFGALGLLLVGASTFAGGTHRTWWMTFTMILGGLSLITAHTLNLSACRTCAQRPAPTPPPQPHDRSSSATANQTTPDKREHGNA
jgi:hypothetical protein